MKKLYLLLLLLACVFSAIQSRANEVTVRGYVKFANGAKAANIKVKIFVEAPCIVELFATTNSDGFYSAKIHCEGAIKKVRVSVQCEGNVISKLLEVSVNNVVEANFTLCHSPVACAAKFSGKRIDAIENQKNRFQFNSAESISAREDKIIHRSWNFGDGVVMNEGTVDPTHNYEKPGVYNVCLTIKTEKGCSNTKCMTVEVKPRCQAEFRFEHADGGMRFNSSESLGTPTDPIIGRQWNFGDGTPVEKNTINPVHKFPRPGAYNVCLVVWTAGGCETRQCKQVVVPESKPECLARFSFERIAPKKFRFNSGLSVVTPGDEIIERQWEFRDGSQILKTRDISVVHEFEKPGLYEVCLKIRTAKGCESRFCLAVKVGDEENPGGGAVKIVSLYPIPVHNELRALIYSREDNLPARISIVDVYGQIKWTKQVRLVKGNNPFEIPTGALLPGPYFITVVTSFGVESKRIYKI